MRITFPLLYFKEIQEEHCATAKGQIKPKADCRTVDYPKKRMNEFVCLFCREKQKSIKNQIRSFVFWENLRRVNLLTVLSDL